MTEKNTMESISDLENNKHPETGIVRAMNEAGEPIEGVVLLTQEELKKYLEVGESLTLEHIGVNRKSFWILRGVTAERANELMAVIGARRMSDTEIEDQQLKNIGKEDWVLSFDKKDDWAGTGMGNRNIYSKGLSELEHHTLVRQYQIENRSRETTDRVEKERADFEKDIKIFSKVAKQSFEATGNSKEAVDDALRDVFGYRIESDEV